MIKDHRILYIDDDAICQNEISRILGIYNIFDSVDSIASAKQMLKQNVYNVVLVDVSLPDGNGIEFIPAIAAHNKQCAIIVISGDNSLSTIARGIALGAHDYLVKSAHTVEDLIIRLPIALSHAAHKAKNESLLSRPDALLPVNRGELTPAKYKKFIQKCEAEYLKSAFKLCNGNISDVGKKTGLARSTLFKKKSLYFYNHSKTADRNYEAH